MTCIDLFCGLGGWAEGFLAEGYRVIGFDIERHDYGRGSYPGQLVLQDARTLHGSQFKDATVIVASPPCTEPSYRAMPWKQARAIKPDVLPEWWNKCEFNPKVKVGKVPMMTPEEMAEWRQYQLDYPLPPPSGFIELFDTCFRIQREASEATGRHIPMVVENVRGAQRWVGRAKANYGSFYLWGDVGMVGRRVVGAIPRYGEGVQAFRDGKKVNPDGSEVEVASGASLRIDVGKGARFTSRDCGVEGRKVAGLNWSAFGDPDYRPKGFNVTAAQRYREGRKQEGSGEIWFDRGIAKLSSKSDSRKAASAEIAKIPVPLAIHIAKTFANSSVGDV